MNMDAQVNENIDNPDQNNGNGGRIEDEGVEGVEGVQGVQEEIHDEEQPFPVQDQDPDNADNTDDIDVQEVNKDYDCFCCGKRIINASPKIVLTFFVSVLVISLCFVFMFTRGDVVIFAPIVAGVVGFWLPSPVQSSQSRKDALQNARLLQNNVRMNRMMMNYGMGNPYRGNMGGNNGNKNSNNGNNNNNNRRGNGLRHPQPTYGTNHMNMGRNRNGNLGNVGRV